MKLTTRINHLRAVLIAVLAAAAAALGLANAPPAHADESSYLTAVANGIDEYGFYGPSSGFLFLGHGACTLVALGESQASVIDWVVARSGPGIYEAGASYIVIAAEVYLC